MFYTYLLLGKRGILSKIWIAAHWEKKLTKAHIFECNLESAIQSIMAPKVMLALRTSGHLLLGVVRIYHRKTKYLLADCNETLLSMKIAFRPGALDLTENDHEASYNAITLPEEFPDFDMQLPDLNLIDVVDHFALNQSRIEDITIREDCDLHINLHNSFGDDLDPFRHGDANDAPFEVSNGSVLPEQSSALIPNDTTDLFADDLFGDEDSTTDLFEDNELFNETSILIMGNDMSQEVMLPPEDQPPETHLNETQELPSDDDDDDDDDPVANTTTLVSDEEVGFVLEPIDVSVIEKKKRNKRKRKLMVDKLKEIPSSCMQEQLNNIADTITTLNIAPPTQRLMEWKLNGGVQWLLSHPSQPIISAELLMLFTQIQTVDIPIDMQEEPAEPTDTTREQEEIDLPQLEVAKLTDIGSSITDPLCTMVDLNDCLQAISDMDSSEYEEHADCMLVNSPNCLEEELSEPTKTSLQSNGEEQWNKRTENLLNDLRKMNQSGVSSFCFQNFCKNDKRKQVSAKFYSFLVLKKQSAVNMTQTTPYGDITVIPGPTFHML
ncbi:double-strand-break repair protein rad21-like protein 1 [Leptodactylus fuscus]|uniref:double-strand-break repair protein rad21-like protein 1 n=1 Tax=Leptodactylus fuscus TaxID=238119 RepID=UPI003F4F331E